MVQQAQNRQSDLDSSTGRDLRGEPLASLRDIIQHFGKGDAATALAELNKTACALEDMYNALLQKYAQLEAYATTIQDEALRMGTLLCSPSYLSDYYRRLEYEVAELPSIRKFRATYPSATYEQYAEWQQSSDTIPAPPNPIAMSGIDPWRYIQGDPTQAWRVIDQAGIGALLQ